MYWCPFLTPDIAICPRSRFRGMAVLSVRKTTILRNERGINMGQVVEIARRRKRARTNVKRNVPPGRAKNADLRTREYLTPDEVSALVKHAGSVGRHKTRDRTLMLTLYRHGLRVSELIDLKWTQVDFKQAENACQAAERRYAGSASCQRRRAALAPQVEAGI